MFFIYNNIRLTFTIHYISKLISYKNVPRYNNICNTQKMSDKKQNNLSSSSPENEELTKIFQNHVDTASFIVAQQYPSNQDLAQEASRFPNNQDECYAPRQLEAKKQPAKLSKDSEM